MDKKLTALSVSVLKAMGILEKWQDEMRLENEQASDEFLMLIELMDECAKALLIIANISEVSPMIPAEHREAYDKAAKEDMANIKSLEQSIYMANLNRGFQESLA